MTVNHIPIAEFRKKGFLQEANRQFFHPLGLALEVHADEEGNETLGGIRDYRHDPEGIVFGEGVISADKAETVEKQRLKHLSTRQRLRYTDGIQPVTTLKDTFNITGIAFDTTDSTAHLIAEKSSA